jgi:hypothetical protein
MNNGRAKAHIPPFQEAIIKYRNPARQTHIEQVKDGEEIEYDPWSVTIDYGRRDNFVNILDFFVNLPSMQNTVAYPSVTSRWAWEVVELETVEKKFDFRPEILRLLHSKSVTDTLIEEGWLLKDYSGPLDSDTTSRDTSYLIGTKKYFMYIQIYMEIIH